ncbi:methyl-accepting chemotaxis protein [Phreatobacter stygius]|uniref:HAMP domain-containing protein n=1 Tax=Phreatobacter stygius TaxID=1940610 RepID=A0A4D7BBU7_9HYPH|nr:HAMP domain-containing methyl-accepting chemotaxis protein [Phreatobacter stygius]QCI65497.1 HAMP domain-containing protein [Phreatobacter stygius]
MSVLARIRITSKLMIIILALNLVAVTMAGVGYYALKRVGEETARMANVAKRATTSARMGQNAMMIGRLEAVMAASPTAEIVNTSLAGIRAELKTFGERAALIRSSPWQPARETLTKVEAALDRYKTALGPLQDRARAISGTATAEQQKQLAEVLSATRQPFLDVRNAMRELTEMQSNRVDEFAQGVEALGTDMSRLLMILGGLGLLAGIGLGIAVGRFGIAVPITRLTALLNALAKGRFDVDVDGTARQDEIGDIARAAATFKQNGIEARDLREAQEAAKARAAAEQKALLNRMADEFDAAVGGIVANVSASSEQLKAAAETLSGTAAEAAAQSGAVAAASEQGSGNIQTVASATEEMAASVREIGAQVERSAHMASGAVSGADLSAVRVKDLSEKVQKIGEIVELINAIAAQTNLLALNATIEAARAGEAGRGFAVVASEVKSLADQTAKATTEIANQIGGIQSATSESASAITGIAKTIREISAVAGDIAAAVDEQSAATQEIARNVQQASAGSSEVSANIAGVSQAVSETGAAAAQVLSSAEGLAAQAGQLRSEMARFLATVRAA